MQCPTLKSDCTLANVVKTPQYYQCVSQRSNYTEIYIYTYPHEEGIVFKAARCAHPNTSKLPITKAIVIGAQSTT